MVMLDLQKAFDTVDHALLMFKLCMGLNKTAVNWFRSYLTGGSQACDLTRGSQACDLTRRSQVWDVDGTLLESKEITWASFVSYLC
jgi:hypothetical protein